MTKSKYTIEMNKRYGDKLKDRKKSTLSKYFNIRKTFLDEVYDRGLGAAKSAGMRAGVTSANQWATARLYKFILNVVAARQGEKVNTGAGEDSDVIFKVTGTGTGTKTMTLKKAKGGDAKYIARIDGKSYKFGNKNYRDYTLMNTVGNKYYSPLKADRERVRSNYRRRHKGDKLDEISSGSLSYYLLWNLPTLRASIKDYEKRFKIKIIF